MNTEQKPIQLNDDILKLACKLFFETEEGKKALKEKNEIKESVLEDDYKYSQFFQEYIRPASGITYGNILDLYLKANKYEVNYDLKSFEGKEKIIVNALLAGVDIKDFVRPEYDVDKLNVIVKALKGRVGGSNQFTPDEIRQYFNPDVYSANQMEALLKGCIEKVPIEYYSDKIIRHEVMNDFIGIYERVRNNGDKTTDDLLKELEIEKQWSIRQYKESFEKIIDNIKQERNRQKEKIKILNEAKEKGLPVKFLEESGIGIDIIKYIIEEMTSQPGYINNGKVDLLKVQEHCEFAINEINERLSPENNEWFTTLCEQFDRVKNSIEKCLSKEIPHKISYNNQTL